MRIWFDFQAAPDPFFFKPVIERMCGLGHQFVLTAREYGETVAVARHCGLDPVVVGDHGGSGLLNKVASTAGRIYRLQKLAARQQIDLAVSINSYAQAIAAYLCGIRFVTYMDFEYHPLNPVAFRFADTVVVPQGYCPHSLSKQVGDLAKARTLNGLKEHISTAHFAPDPGFSHKLSALGIGSRDVVATMRPPPTSSVYHRFENDLFDQLAVHLASHKETKIVYLPRTAEQSAGIRQAKLANIIVPETFIDGLQLVHASDLVISAGGSMNREAVALGTPAYTLFKGKMAGVDRQLIAEGRMTEIRTAEDFHRVVLGKAVKKPLLERRTDLLEQFTSILCQTGSGDRA